MSDTPRFVRPWGTEEEYDEWRSRRDREELARRAREVMVARGLDALDKHRDIEIKPWIGGFLWGGAGVGKTRLALEMLAESPGACFISTREFLKLARIVSMERADEKDQDRYDLASSCGSLVFDDLGIRTPSDFAYEEIYALLDSRLGKPTIVTSNVDLQRIAEIYDDRVASRIASFGPVIEMKGKDWRLP